MKIIFVVAMLAICLQSTLSLNIINSTKIEAEEMESLEETTSTTTTERSIEEIKRQEYQRALAQNRALNGKHFHYDKTSKSFLQSKISFRQIQAYSSTRKIRFKSSCRSKVPFSISQSTQSTKENTQKSHQEKPQEK